MTTPRPGPVCWGCDPSRIGALARRLLRLQPAQHNCQVWIRYATTATRCRCGCRPELQVHLDGGAMGAALERARDAADTFRPGEHGR